MYIVTYQYFKPQQEKVPASKNTFFFKFSQKEKVFSNIYQWAKIYNFLLPNFKLTPKVSCVANLKSSLLLLKVNKHHAIIKYMQPMTSTTYIHINQMYTFLKIKHMTNKNKMRKKP